MTALTQSAQRWQTFFSASVTTLMSLAESGMSRSEVRAHLKAGRFQRFGRAIVTHNQRPTRLEWEHIALILCGPRSAR